MRAIGSSQNALPIVDSLRQPDYSLGDISKNLPARLVCLSFAFVAVRYYQNIVGGITTRVVQSPAVGEAPLRISTEWTMRTMAIWSSWLILACNLVQVRWWPLGTAIGYSGVVVANMTGARFVRTYLARARERGLSTVPSAYQKITGLDAYLSWVPKMSFLALAVWPIAILIYLGLIKDVYIYSGLVVSLNIGLLYIITTGIGAFDVRVALNRCYLAAERLRYEAESLGGLRRSAAATRQPILANPV
jgi:hypothetical protein